MTARTIFAGTVFAMLLALIAVIEVVDYAACHAGGGG